MEYSKNAHTILQRNIPKFQIQFSLDLYSKYFRVITVLLVTIQPTDYNES